MGLSDDLAAMRDDLDRSAQRLERTQPKSSQTGVTADGRIEVVIAPTGVPERVVVHEGWRDAVGLTGLGEAVVEAYNAASVAVLEEWGSLQGQNAEEPEPRARPVASISETFAGRLAEVVERRGDEANTERMLRELAGVLRETNESVGEAKRVAQERTSQSHTGKDSGRVVAVTLGPTGQILCVEFDRTWLEARHAANISKRINEALENAKASIGGAATTSLLEGTKLAELVALVSDPEALAQRLGF